MGERINIFGGKNCLMPNGKQCIACCKSYEIPKLSKPAWQLCVHAQAGKGCDIYGRPEMPDICKNYFCSDQPLSHQVQVMGAAYSLGQINLEQTMELGKKLEKLANPKK